jgi:ribonucleoside-diphosphate reductase alpha chain
MTKLRSLQPRRQQPPSLTKGAVKRQAPSVTFSAAATAVLRSGKILAAHESPEQMVDRVSGAIFAVERRFGSSEREIAEWRDRFLTHFAAKRVTFGSPVLTNAGRHTDAALGSCAAIPVDLAAPFEQNRTMIEAYYRQNMGSGFDLTPLADPVAMLETLNAHAAEQTASGGYDRYIGNMANLDIEHPRIAEFITAKVSRPDLCHFNISVNVSDGFMEALQMDRLLDCESKRRELWRLLIDSAYACGDPGVLYLDRSNRDNPTPSVGSYTTTAPCAEVALGPGESCVFGYVNLGRCLDARGALDFDILEDAAATLTRALDNALELSIERYPSPRSALVMSAKRKIGIGICGYADLLASLDCRYGSMESCALLEDVLATITFVSKVTSARLAVERGSFSSFAASKYARAAGYLAGRYGSLSGLRVGPSDWRELDAQIRAGGLRHASTTTLPPTGRAALLLDASPSLEPWLSLFTCDGALRRPVAACVDRHCTGSAQAQAARETLASYATAQAPVPNIPETARPLLRLASEVPYEEHLLTVAAAQRCIDEGISKTVNLPSNAKRDAVSEIFSMAWDLGLKAISVYRATGTPDKLLASSDR